MSSEGSLSPVVRTTALRALAVIVIVGVWVYIGRQDLPRGADGLWAFCLRWGVPLLMLLGGAILQSGLRSRADHRALSQWGTVAPRAGAWVAVAGTAEAKAETFEAPLVGGPALASSYEVLEELPHIGDRGTSRHTSPRLERRYDGYELVPTVIDSELGKVELYGFPDLRGLEAHKPSAGTELRLDDSKARGKPVPRFLAHLSILAPVQNRLSVMWKYDDFRDPLNMKREERLLRPGDEVCVLGRWRDGKLMPSAQRPRGLPVYQGKPDAVLHELGEDSKAFTIFGVGSLTLAALVLLWVIVTM